MGSLNRTKLERSLDDANSDLQRAISGGANERVLTRLRDRVNAARRALYQHRQRMERGRES